MCAQVMVHVLRLIFVLVVMQDGVDLIVNFQFVMDSFLMQLAFAQVVVFV